MLPSTAFGLTLRRSGALPALATWSEGSEPGQNIDPARTQVAGSSCFWNSQAFQDSTEAYNRKAAAVVSKLIARSIMLSNTSSAGMMQLEIYIE